MPLPLPYTLRPVLSAVVWLVASAASSMAAEQADHAQAQPARPSFKPNVIVLFTDDQGYADVSANGCKDYQTPHLDSIARDGVKCTSGYVSQPQCSPSRAGMLTGRHQSRFGHEENPPSDGTPLHGLPATERTLADHLRAAGYATGHVGKWHQGSHSSHNALRRGFAESVTVDATHDGPEAMAADKADWKKRFPAARGKYGLLHRNGTPEPMVKYVADALADEAVAFVDRHKGEPFLLYWAHPFPHVPQTADAKYLKRVEHIKDEKRRVYAAMMLAVDDGVGRLLDAVRRHGLDQQTLIFYMSDNGGPADGRLPCDNTPFRGAKGGMYEGGVRVPYFVRWTGTLPAGQTYDRPVSTLDILPTALAAAGVKPPADRPLDGVDLVPFLTGKRSGDPHSRLYWRYLRRGTFAIRDGDWKVMKERGKNEKPKLFDLANDPGETNDQADKHPDRAAALLAAYEAWAKDLPKPLWNNDRDDGDLK